MKRNLILIAFILLTGILTGSFAQQARCGFDHQHQLMIEASPELEKELQKELMLFRQQVKADDAPDQYVIPVVFHVFGTSFNSGARVSYNRVKDALDATNKDFQGLTSGYHSNDPSSRFEEIKKPLNIEFRLAKIDPTGRPTTGVLFYENKAGFGESSGYDDEIRKYAWDNSKYMNVYIMRDLYNDGDYFNSGVAWLPNIGMTQSNTARVVYNGSYLGSNTDENFRRILTHEFGHFLGLHHTFQGGCTYPNDGVEDTPPVETSHWPKDRVNCEGDYTDWENFMNYSTNYKHFTAGQVELMEYYLGQRARNTLWKPANLIATGVDDSYVESPVVMATSTTAGFHETVDNQGQVGGELTFTGSNGRTFARTGQMTLGTDYTITGLPEGLTPVLTVTSNVKAILVFNGTALNHEARHSVEDLLVVLKPNMLSGDGEIGDEDFITKVMFEDPYTEFCMFNVRWAQYAHIKKVEFAGMVSETDSDGEQYKDLRDVAIAGFEEAGKTYTLKTTVENVRSGKNDPYLVRLWIDWNGDFVLSSSELIGTKRIARIGDSGTKHEVTFDVTVPEDFPVGKKIGFRVMLHFEQGNDGVDPCGTIDSGDVEDYSAWIGEPKSPEPPKQEPCDPQVRYRPYAQIAKVSFNGMINDSEVQSVPAVYEDFTSDQSKHVYLETGKSYTMEVTVKNYDSGNEDPYVVRAYVDWNSDGYIATEEGQVDVIPQIGPKGNPIVKTFNFTVPEDAATDQPLRMRVLLHYGTATVSENPCGSVESAQYEEYFVYVSAATGTNKLQAERVNIYPNPTRDILYIDSDLITGYSLYSIDGMLVGSSDASVQSIDLSAFSRGIYFLKLQIDDDEIIKKVILE